MRRGKIRTGIRRKKIEQRYATQKWSDKLPDIPAFVLGNAPSLDEWDMSILEEYFTIGINRAFLRLDPTILLWQDISLWNTEYEKLKNLQAIKVCRDVCDVKRQYFNFRAKGSTYEFKEKSCSTLYGRGSTGPLAVQFAIGLGCRPIILLGMDCKVQNGKTDFYGKNRFHLPHTIQNCAKGLKAMKKKCPVEIINCGNTKLWPKRDLLEVIDSLGTGFKLGRQAYTRQILGSSA